jgi:tetratricopeptide (TPR) repeat protein
VDVGLAATVAGTIAGVAITGLGVWLGWLAFTERTERRRERSSNRAEAVATGVSLGVPIERLPADVRGREDLIQSLVGQLPSGGLVVLAGTGGVGKSTVAAEVARRARVPRLLRRPLARQVWWISAASVTSLTAGMVGVAGRLGATRADLEAIDRQSADAPDRLWALLEGASRGWLLVIDCADDPGLLAAPPFPDGAADGQLSHVADGTGWVRSSPRGLVVVTSRHADESAWGPQAAVHRLSPLGDREAGRVLRDLAPAAGGQFEAESLARRLGGLPLALHLAGLQIAAEHERWPSFEAYRLALDRDPVPARQLDLDGDIELPREHRAVVMRAWELSLDALAAHGLPEARLLLLVLSCYAPALPIPMELLRRAALSPLPHQERLVGRGSEEVVGALARLGMIEDASEQTAVVVHPVVAAANRARLRSPTIPPDPNPDFVRDTAVVPLLRIFRKLDATNPSHWPSYRQLAPHMLALLQTSGPHLAQDRLANLLDAAGALADACDSAGATTTAMAVTGAALRLSERLGVNHPTDLALRYRLAVGVGQRGRWNEAEAAFRQVLEAQRLVLGADHRATLDTRHGLARAMARQGRWTEAERTFREVLAARERVLGADHPATLATRSELARALTKQESA